MAKAAYVLSFLSWSGKGTTKMVGNERRPSGLKLLILIKSPSISPLDIKLVLHRSRCEYLVEGSSPPWARLPLVFSG